MHTLTKKVSSFLKWLRQPTILVVLGVFFVVNVFLFSIRPFLRHVPAPLPLLGQWPQELVDVRLSSQEARGRVVPRVTLVGVVPVGCHEFSECPAFFDPVENLQRQFGESTIPVSFVLLTPGNFDSSRVPLSFVPTQAALPVAWRSVSAADRAAIGNAIFKNFEKKYEKDFGFEMLEKKLFEQSPWNYFFLIDSNNFVRAGFYMQKKEVLDEVFHRVMQVHYGNTGSGS